jgi:SAM-dependent methyltransferase
MRRKAGRSGAGLAEVSAAGKGLRSLDPMGNGLRWVTVARLSLERGDVVLGVGCGTGNNFPFIQHYIGGEGRIIGMELSPDMPAQASTKIQTHGWDEVSLIESSAEEADIPVTADAALFCLTHDILQSVAAVENVMSHVRTGGHVSNLGPKWAPWWAAPVNFGVWLITRRYAQGAFSAVGPSRDIRTGSPS